MTKDDAVEMNWALDFGVKYPEFGFLIEKYIEECERLGMGENAMILFDFEEWMDSQREKIQKFKLNKNHDVKY